MDISKRNRQLKQDNTHTHTIGCPPYKCGEFHHGNLGNRGISGQFPGQVLVYTFFFKGYLCVKWPDVAMHRMPDRSRRETPSRF